MWVRLQDSSTQNETLDHPTVLGVHSNDWNILSGYFHITTRRVVGFGDINAHIYDVNESYQTHHIERDMIPCSTEHRGIMDTKGITNGSLL